VSPTVALQSARCRISLAMNNTIYWESNRPSNRDKMVTTLSLHSLAKLARTKTQLTVSSVRYTPTVCNWRSFKDISNSIATFLPQDTPETICVPAWHFLCFCFGRAHAIRTSNRTNAEDLY
jgi:hypothetical protein